jgi:hypothetical protein
MSAAIVASGIAFGVMLMPANPPSPFRFVKTDRYAPGGGTDSVGVVGEEHALVKTMQSMSEMAKRVDTITDSFVAHTGGACIRVSMVVS